MDWRRLLLLACLLSLFLALSCVVAPSEHVGSARRVLANSQVPELLHKYTEKVYERIETCEKFDLATEEQRESCMGDFAPDGPLPAAIRRIRLNYDEGAGSLSALERDLQLVEEYLR